MCGRRPAYAGGSLVSGMAPAGSFGRLVGRREEIGCLADLVAAARAGRGAALVVHGEAGMGKSALLDHARLTAHKVRVLCVSGAQYDSELPFAALHQLCLPLLSRLSGLPARRREALRTAFGLVNGTPDVLRVGLAVLELLSCAAKERALLCLIDDAHWLDTASARVLAFLARRIACEPVAMVFAVRPGGAAGELEELPGLHLGGLSDTDAQTLLAARSHLTLDDQVRQRLMAEARGNPLALLELPLAGGFAPPDTASLPTRIERSYQARLEGLPAAARLLLTVASADPTGDPQLLWPAARHLDIDIAVAGMAAAATGLVDFSTRIHFCHPLARSAVYRAAPAQERYMAHRALAEVTDPAADPDRLAWHRAQSGTGPDEDIAAELECSALRARARGGTAATAAFLERAAVLSPTSVKRTERTLAAVGAHIEAGMNDSARHLLTAVANMPLDQRQRAQLDLLKGQLAILGSNPGNGPRFILRAAQQLADIDPQWSRQCYLDALETSLGAGRVTGVMDLVLTAARNAPPPAPDVPDVLEALIRLTTDGHRAAYPLLRKALDGDDTPLWTHRPALAVVIASELWDPDTHTVITQWLMKTGRASGSPLLLRFGLAQTATAMALAGDLGQAMAAIAEEEAVADAIGGPAVTYPRLQLAAMRGRREEVSKLFDTVTAAATASGTGRLIADAHWAAAVLHNGLADHPAALAAARRAVAHTDFYLTGFILPELVEAAVRCGEYETAATALDSLTESTDASATSSGLGIAAYARGLVTGHEEHYRQAVAHLEKSPLVPYRGRAHLLYGQWLRHKGRRREAKDQLRTAHQLLSQAGIEAFARRAADELRATGEKVPDRSKPGYDQLTEQEVRIARLVATGATSKEVAARLLLSPRTIDAHLRNIFRKCGITSRRQLKDHPAFGSG
ncbi:AAA family ATPase [Streptomyces sp. NPDC006285]|uniref:AAA family ATPase n=1 Tax=Streptomyces sp. NPDC006285 TaxID=3364742 RepID=UPI0036BCF69A